MSRTVSVTVTDDIDGSENAETVTFAYGGVSYKIDLGSPNRAGLERVFAPFIAAGRHVDRGSNGRSGRSGGSHADRAAVRAWARQAGLPVSDRGRISSEVVRQYEASH